MAGIQFITLIFVNPIILNDSAIISMEPIIDICDIISAVSIGDTRCASIVRPPSITSTGIAENITPTPSAEVKAIAEIQSITDFE